MDNHPKLHILYNYVFFCPSRGQNDLSISVNLIKNFQNTFYKSIDKIDIYDDFTITDLWMGNYLIDDGKLNDIILLNNIQRILSFIDVSSQRFLIKEPDQKWQYYCLHETTQVWMSKKRFQELYLL